MSIFSDQDEDFMRKALELAKLGRGSVSLNPMVGAVVVKDGMIIGEGFHEKYGGHHAEVNAVRAASGSLEGCTMYITLEPCCFAGKTPACTDLLGDLGLKRIVVAMLDPNPKVQGQGVELLKSKGVQVDVGLLSEESRVLNQHFLKYMATGLPYVTVKVAMSLDGKICCNDGSSQWITNETSRKSGHVMRAENDAILVGSNTVVCDDPHLGVRGIPGKDPMRIVLDSNARLPLKSKVFRDDNVVVVVKDAADLAKVAQLKAAGMNVLSYGEIDLRIVLKDLAEQFAIGSVLIEGGAAINGSLLEDDLIDRDRGFIAPKLIGGKEAKSPIGG